MGEVYEAEDLKPHRRVALKSCDGEALIAWLPRLRYQVLADGFIGRMLHQSRMRRPACSM